MHSLPDAVAESTRVIPDLEALEEVCLVLLVYVPTVYTGDVGTTEVMPKIKVE